MEEILELVGTPVVICSPDGAIQWQSSRARDCVAELPPVNEWALGPAGSGRNALEAMKSTPSGGVEVWLQTPEGDAAPFVACAGRAGESFIVTLTPRAQSAHDYPRERAPDVFFRLSEDGRIEFASGPCMGKPPESIQGHIFPDLLPPRWAGPVRRRLEDLAADPRAEVSRSRFDYNGEERVMVSRFLPVIDDSVVRGFVLQWWDITDEQDARDALKVTERQYRQVIENSLDLVGIFDAERHRLQFVSPNCQEFLGLRAEDVVGRSVFDFIDPRDHEITRQRIHNLAIARSSDETLEVRTQHASGKTLLLEGRARILATEGEEQLVIMNARDISERRESQLLRRNLMRADKLAAIGQVAASVAHEVNNPASFITTNLHVMRDDFVGIRKTLNAALEIVAEVAPERMSELRPDPLEASEPLDNMLAEIDKMLETNLEGMARISHIVRELRSFSRTDDEGVSEFMDLTDTLRAACAMVRNQITYFAELEDEFADELPLVYADRGKISQVVVNLLVNASQAVQQADRDQDHRVTLKAYAGDGIVRVDVEDTGCGVKPSVAERIFDPFFTTKEEEEGTGLGLWLCQEIVQKSGGRLWLDHSGASGSRFSFTLPAQSLVEIPESPFEEVSSSAHENVDRARVLLVDDDELVLESYRKILERHHEIVAAVGGEHAIELLTDDHGFDVVVCDIIMPQVDGVDLYQYLERNHPDLVERTYFCTAGVFTDRTRAFVARVRDRVVHKPISARQLKSLVAGAAGFMPTSPTQK